MNYDVEVGMAVQDVVGGMGRICGTLGSGPQLAEGLGCGFKAESKACADYNAAASASGNANGKMMEQQYKVSNNYAPAR